MRKVQRQYIWAFYVALAIVIVFFGLRAPDIRTEEQPEFITENFWSHKDKVMYRERGCKESFLIPFKPKDFKQYDRKYFGDGYALWTTPYIYCETPEKIKVFPSINISTLKILNSTLLNDKFGLISVSNVRSEDGKETNLVSKRIPDTSGTDYVYRQDRLIEHAGKLYIYRNEKLEEIVGADPQQYKLTRSFNLWVDNDGVYFDHVLLPDISVDDLVIISPTYAGYVYSRGYVYSQGKKVVAVEDATKFTPIDRSYTYWTDGKNIFAEGKDMQIDRASFFLYQDPKTATSSQYAGDGVHVYYDGDIIADVDLPSFKIITTSFARDAKKFYMSGTVMAGNPDELEQKALKGELSYGHCGM